MKAVFASFSCLSAILALLLFAPSLHGAESTMESTARAFKDCNAVFKHGIGAENFEHTKLPVHPDYIVDLFIAKLPPPPNKTTPIVVWIEDGPGARPENPRITAVCVGKQFIAPNPNEPPGRIEFHSSTGDSITIRMHLDGLKKSKWKKDSTGLANDSILMKQLAALPVPPATYPPLSSTDWPSCVGGKKVQVSDDPLDPTHHKDTEISFDFSRCANPGGPDLYYVYKLLLAQPPTSGFSGDYPIDPWIINHP